MLPVIIYDREHGCRMQMLAYLNDYSRRTGERFTVLGNADTTRDAVACLAEEGGIVLVLAGVEADKGEESALVEEAAIGRNRDSYVLYWLKDVTALHGLAAHCRRPAGFLIPPPQQAQFDRILDRVMRDYRSIAAEKDEEFISLQNAGTLFRLPVGKIEYIEALEKKMNIWTNGQCFTVYETLSRMAENLGERFFRCHRSYLVNYARIVRVDYAGMELEIDGGVRLPLSRSAKDRLKARMEEEATTSK